MYVSVLQCERIKFCGHLLLHHEVRCTSGFLVVALSGRFIAVLYLLCVLCHAHSNVLGNDYDPVSVCYDDVFGINNHTAVGYDISCSGVEPAVGVGGSGKTDILQVGSIDNDYVPLLNLLDPLTAGCHYLYQGSRRESPCSLAESGR